MSASFPLTRRKAGRFWIILACLLCLGGAVGLVLNALSSTIVFFMAPSQVLAHPPTPTRTIRLGGMVVAGSLHTGRASDDTPEARFDVTDGQAAVTVQYRGILPDLFREGQSVVALGRYDGHGFTASEVLAKHDETYMPKEVADALQKSGRWDPRFGPPPNAADWNSMTVPHPDTPPGPGAAP
ncbi:cytochrome c maturation protein CcmE [Bombella apis]|uniref:Cytochrome c-type biogenesis protein CcmE n=1 Tax=Bombella apis TaxID=1785988 RepID=A0ABR9MLT6_9PROT|nr:cytochrome c maturation protein CcmE [Bombella apis]MBE1722817.1 cytochrome c maturation protein CcmE [Bombella apis]MBR9730622.1 cytochrome c maturation protein CcmE [Bombella apis]